MKRTSIVLAILSAVLLTAVAGAFAYTPTRMRANIGFPFYADDQLLPAGNYWFEVHSLSGNVAGSPIAIRSEDGAVYQLLNTRIVGSENRDAGDYLVFNRIGGTCFLSKVQQGTLQGNLPKSRSQKELKTAAAAGSGTAEEAVIIAAAR